jgi:hypothetical protein
MELKGKYMFDIIDDEYERIYILKFKDYSPELHTLEQSVDNFIRFDHRHLVLDMKEQEIINSLLLAFFVRIRSRLLSEQRDLRLINCSLFMYKSFEMAGLASYFVF